MSSLLYDYPAPREILGQNKFLLTARTKADVLICVTVWFPLHFRFYAGQDDRSWLRWPCCLEGWLPCGGRWNLSWAIPSACR